MSGSLGPIHSVATLLAWVPGATVNSGPVAVMADWLPALASAKFAFWSACGIQPAKK